ncbi:MAG: VOC family protein [Bryobacteraceae bacterium]
MKYINTYLNFDGTCKEAMTFYAKCLGGELQVMPFSAEMPDRVMHARLTSGSAILMASDTQPGTTWTAGSNFAIAIQCESGEEVDTLHAALAAGGNVTMPVQDTFWNARFGMLTDRFGVNWMFNYEKPQA